LNRKCQKNFKAKLKSDSNFFKFNLNFSEFDSNSKKFEGKTVLPQIFSVLPFGIFWDLSQNKNFNPRTLENLLKKKICGKTEKICVLTIKNLWYNSRPKFESDLKV
jgi:hypothetical protein